MAGSNLSSRISNERHYHYFVLNSNSNKMNIINNSHTKQQQQQQHNCYFKKTDRNEYTPHRISKVNKLMNDI